MKEMLITSRSIQHNDENYYSLDLVEDAIEEETESLRQQYIESLQGDGWPMLWCNPHYTSS